MTDRDYRRPRPMLAGDLDRPLRYTPDGGDFVITNGAEYFNRPLYGGSSPFRVDAGDRPEFSFYLPGRGGNLRFGFSTAAGTKWLHDAAHIVARYRAGSMIHEIGDPLLGRGRLRLTALAPRAPEGLVVRLETEGLEQPLDVIVAFGGITGERHGRDGDIGTDRLPMREYFQFKPDSCRDNVVTLGDRAFTVRGKSSGSVAAVLPEGSVVRVSDAANWDHPATLLSAPVGQNPAQPIAAGRFALAPGRAAYVALQHIPAPRSGPELLGTYQEVAAERAIKSDPAAAARRWTGADLPGVFARAEAERRSVAERVTVRTPDPFLDAAMPALNIAADAVWDDRQSAYVHGGVAWRVRLLGWRIGYTGDVLGWHERTRAHFDGYAAQQNTDPVPAALPTPEASANLARHETALHSNGDLTKSHYDMNLVGVDVFFRHLLWTGDLDYARRMWPVIERHLAWERRLFRREFGPDKLPLYEAYCCIWASDALAYNGGGVTHSTAYNLYHNRMAARVAKLIGVDPAPYEREAALIDRALRAHLWLPDRGWFAEWKDLLGLQLVHPNAAAWTFYHTVDSEVPTPREAWQMTRFVDTGLPHFPVRGSGVPAGNYTISTTSWMPFTWSLNNVAFGESIHTALGLWQANRADAAYALLKGALLDSMYLGLCPGNVGMCTWYDVYRRESQRDFADGTGMLPRAILEGLFGLTPDLLAGEVRVRPGFPADWTHAEIKHPDFDFRYKREAETENYSFESRFARPVGLRLQVAAWRDDIASVEINGRSARWRPLDDCVGTPRIEITAPAAAQHTIVLRWRGSRPAVAPPEVTVALGAAVDLPCGATVEALADPQGVLDSPRTGGAAVAGTATGSPGHRTVFAQVRQGSLRWWQPLSLEIREARPAKPLVFVTDWKKPAPAGVRFDPLPLSGVFNDRLTQIFRNEYLTPRSPFVSLATPKQGYGNWCGPTMTYDVDDAGLRAAAAANGGRIILPNGVPLATPGKASVKNVAFVSHWDNYPAEITTPLSGRAARAFLLVAGSTSGTQSRFDNGEIIVTYVDGSVARLALENPTTWWPIDQDYFIDDFAFRRPGPLPLRVDLKTGRMRVLDAASFAGKGGRLNGGAATVLDVVLDPAKELKSLTVRALANEVVIGLMSITLQRP